MSSLIFSIPGKTFIAGEYSILKGGAALIAATEPRFEVHVSPGRGELTNIHPESPAGLFHQQHREFFQKFDIHFQDDFGLGGLGASTAQFLALYVFNEWREGVMGETERYLDHHKLLHAYTECAWKGQGYPPSGADLICQERGFLTLFDKSAGRMSVHAWNFENLSFTLIHTGVKLATHEHLKEGRDFEVTSLQAAFQGLVSSLDLQSGLDVAQREEKFVASINGYAEALREQNLTAVHSLKLLDGIREIPGVLACKACGAMGSDVLFVVTKKNQTDALQSFLVEKNLRVIANEKSLSEGLQLRVLKGNLF